MASPMRLPNGFVNRGPSHVLANLPFLDPTKYVVFFDDFTSATLAASGVSGWHLDETGTSVALTVTDAHGGVATIETGNMANDAANYQWALNTDVSEIFKLEAGKKAWLRTKFKVEDVAQDFFHIGLHVATDDATATEPTDMFMFRTLTGDKDAIQFAVGKTASTEVTTGTDLGNLSSNTWYIATAYYDGADTVHVWLETADGTISATSSCDVTDSVQGDLLPDTEMTVGFGIECADTGADLLTLDYIFVAVERD